MVVRFKGDGEWSCLEADTKPANAAVGDKLTVTDIRRIYIKTGPLSADWMDIEHNPMMPGTWDPNAVESLTNKDIDADVGNKLRHITQPDWIIYRTSIGGTIKSYNTDTGDVDYSHPTALDTVLEGTLDNASYKTVYIADWLGSNSIYPISSGFTGFHLKYRTHLIMGKNAKIEVPNGWANNLMILYNTAIRTCSQNTIEGGWFYEAGTPVRAWSAYFLYTDKVSSGNDFNHIRGTTIMDCDIGIELGIGNTPTAWFNGNTFKDITMWYPDIGIDFVDNSPGNNLGINRNYFENIIIQSGSNTTFGARNIKHESQVFVDCKFWDIPAGGRTCSIVTTANGTQIYGGIMGYQGSTGYTDSSTLQNTTIIDEWNRRFGYLTARSKAGDPTTTEVPASQYQLWKNTTSGVVKLWYNDAGTLKGATLT